MRATLDHTEPLAPGISTFWLKPERPLHFTAGQFTEITIPHSNPDSRGPRRQFTISSSPAEELIGITTRTSARDKSTFKRTMMALQAGDTIEMAEPMGDFVLPKLLQVPLVFVAGGIGVTPFLSMAKYLAAAPESRSMHLLYGVSIEDDILGIEEFRKADIHATILVDQPSNAWGGERGRLNGERILQLSDVSDDTLLYLSGPEGMVESLSKELTVAGIQKHQLVTDAFLGYTDA